MDGEYYTYQDISLEQNELLLSYDYVHGLNDKFALFGGATLGRVQNKLSTQLSASGPMPLSLVASGSETDFVYGLQAGIQYRITPTVSADLQYRYMATSSAKLASLPYDAGEESSVYFEIPEYSEITFNIDFRF